MSEYSYIAWGWPILLKIPGGKTNEPLKTSSITGQQPQPLLRPRPHRRGRLQEHHGQTLQQEKNRQGEKEQ